ncbi:MAG: molybdopterin molybdotransferase MoeA [Gaiellales bacterium]|nr:molybdopterin molybdotransferase MoeA [Gaiellales bacterium]
MISIERARKLILSECEPLPAETLPLSAVLGRVLCSPAVADVDIPPFDNSAMDGYAVRAADTVGALPGSPVSLRIVDTIAAGRVGTVEVMPGCAAKIMTGAPMPRGADAVVESEATREATGAVEVVRTVARRENVRPKGEDSAVGSVVLDEGHVLGPAEIGVLASIGRREVRVFGRPSVSILATGSELVEPGSPLAPGQIRNSNSYTAEAQCRELGLEPARLGIARDDYQVTVDLMRSGLSGDILITSGGVSVGEFDFVKQAQDDLGVQRRLWRVAMKPGKPLSFGVFERPDGRRCLVFGVPGNPAAAMVSFELFIRPAVLRMMGRQAVARPEQRAVLAQDESPTADWVRVVRMHVSRDAGLLMAYSTGAQGSGRLRSMVGANALAFVPPGRRLLAGEEVAVLVLGEDLAEV